MPPILSQSELFLKSNPRHRPGPFRTLPLKRQARKDIEGGGVNLNHVREASATRAVKTKQLLMLTLLLLCVSLAREAQAFYNPSTGRWLSRDPITDEQGLNIAEQIGGPNIYGFVGNNPLNQEDNLGLAFYAVDGTWMNATKGANPWQIYLETSERPRYLLLGGTKKWQDGF